MTHAWGSRLTRALCKVCEWLRLPPRLRLKIAAVTVLTETEAEQVDELFKSLAEDDVAQTVEDLYDPEIQAARLADESESKWSMFRSEVEASYTSYARANKDYKGGPFCKLSEYLDSIEKKFETPSVEAQTRAVLSAFEASFLDLAAWGKEYSVIASGTQVHFDVETQAAIDMHSDVPVLCINSEGTHGLAEKARALGIKTSR